MPARRYIAAFTVALLLVAVALLAPGAPPQHAVEAAGAPTTTATTQPATTTTSTAPATTQPPVTEPPTTAPPTTQPPPPVAAARHVEPPPTTAEADPQPDPEPVADPAPSSSAEAAIEQWFPDVYAKAVRVARCESGLNPGIVSPGGGNYGLFQINAVHRDAFANVTGVSFDRGWSNPYLNAQYARSLYDSAGWGPWSCGGA